MAFITNGGAKLIDLARNEGKSIVFGSVRMNTIYESNPSELVQKSEEWFGQNVAEVVGCLSHVSVDDASCVCDSKLAIQCNDNSKPWKSIGIYAHLEDESGEILIACESIQNGDYKNVTIVELPVTLDGAVEDFGLSEGGGGGGDVPANMMTTDTNQDVSGVKTWEHVSYVGSGTADDPQEGDRKTVKRTILVNGENGSLSVSSETSMYDNNRWLQGMQGIGSLSNDTLKLDQGDVLNQGAFEPGASLDIDTSAIIHTYYDNGEPVQEGATWHDIINAANSPAPQVPVVRCVYGTVEEDPDSQLMLFGQLIEEGGSINYDDLDFTFDSNSHLESVTNNGYPATLSVAVIDGNGAVVGSACGLSINDPDGLVPVSFSSPIELQAGYRVYYQYIRQATV